MTEVNWLLKLKNVAGAVINPRKEDGHGSAVGTPSHVSAASLPLPVGAATAANQQTNALTDAQLRAAAVPVSAASLPLPVGAATAANQQTNALTDAQLRATPVPVSGTVAVSNMIPAVETGLAKETTLAARASEATLGAVSGKLPASLGQKASAASLAAVLSTEQEAILQGIKNPVGAVDVAAPAFAKLLGVRDGGGILRAHKGGADGSALVTDAIGYYFSRGELRHVGASITSGIASTQAFRLGLPASSAKHILLLRAFIASSVAATFSLNKDGTLATPTSHTPWNPNYAFGSGTLAQAQTQAAGVVGGTALASAIRAAPDILLPFDLTILIPAGVGATQSICLSAPFSVGATSFVTVVYAEIDP